jgi:VanZ family protein
MPHIKNLLAGKNLFFAALLYSFTITILFFLPTSGMPKINFSYADKIVHALIYFILTVLWISWFYVKNYFRIEGKLIAILFFSALLYGIIIEIFQGLFTVSRSADFFDLIANTIGSLFGIFFFKTIKYYFNT